MPGATLDPLSKEQFSVASLMREESQQTLKYSNSIRTLKTLQLAKDEAPSRYVKKGTSKYLKDILDRQKSNASIYMGSPTAT